MNYSQFTKSTRTDKLQFTTAKNPIMLHMVPEFGYFVVDLLFNSGVVLTNCAGFISKSQNVKLGIKTFNTKRIFLDAKTKIMNHDFNTGKALNVYQDYPTNGIELEKDHKFLIVDHTVLSQASQYITNQSNEKNGSFFLLQQLKKEITFIKSKYPQVENLVLFTLADAKPEIGLADIIDKFVNIPANMSSSLACYDKYMIVSMTSTTEKPIIFPIAGYKKNSSVPEIYKNNLNIIDSVYSSREKETEKETEVITQKIEKPDEIIKREEKFKKELDDLNINRNQLQRIFQKYNIRDKSIADNIKQAIIDYAGDKKDIDKEDLEKVILLAVNKTVFNTDQIDSHYLNNPARLFTKLEEMNTYSKEMKYPKTVVDYILDPSKTIDLKRVTGLVRHKYEFSDNIHKNIEVLFNELQTRSTDPIKVVKIEHKYEDNNLNRVINYEVTLKNLTGKNKKPYKVNFKIPALVNDRYFKLNGKNYILSNQQFFVPITKTEPDECRLMNSYQTLTLSLVNLKINISEISKLLQYIKARYPKLIIDLEQDVNKNVLRAKLKDPDGNRTITIDLVGKTAYEDSDGTKLSLNEESTTWDETKKGKQIQQNLGKSEYLYDKLEELLKKENPDENLNKSAKSIPYIVIHLMALKIALIVYMWQQLGLLKALNKLGIEYKFSNESDPKAAFNIELQNGKFLNIYSNSRRQTLIINGLYTIDFKKYKFKDEKSLDDRHSIDDFLLDKDTRALVNLDLLTENVLDTWTRDILESNGNSTNLVDLLSHDMVDKLLNDQPDQLSDLKIYRNRQAEVIFTLMYRMLMMAHRLYTSEQKFNDEPKLYLSENYVIECLLGVNPHMKGAAAIEMVNPYSPITELKSAAKVIKTGPRGLPNKRMIKLQHRNIHPSYYGNIGANASSEYADVGIVNRLCLTPMLSDKYGSYGIKDIKNTNGWELLSLDEALIPFVNEMNSDRAVLAYTHRAQITPIKDGEMPIVCTGAEFVVPQLASNRFVNIAKHPGEVVEVKPNEYLKVKYDNGVLEYIDITPRLANTKRSSYISLDMQTKPVGYKFEENELLSWTNSFDGDGYTAGRNLTLALMNYDGYSHEDGYVISQAASDKFVTQSLQEINTFVPLNSKVFDMVTENINTEPGQVLLEFGYSGGDLDKYLDEFNIVDDESDESETAVYDYVGKNVRITSPGGEISEIRIYINNKNQVDPSILQIWKKLCNKLKNKVKLYTYGKTTEREKIAALDNLDMSQLKTGNHKYRGKEFEGTRIVFYIKTDRHLGIGDKMCNRYGAKGIVDKILPDDECPRTEYSGRIDIFLSPFGLAGRRNLVVIKEMYLGKILYHLPRILKEKATAYKPEDIAKLIFKVYDILDNSKDKKYYNLIKTKIDKLLAKKKLISAIMNDEIKFIIMAEPFHNVISIENMQEAADLLNIPLDEYVYLPKYNRYTKTKIPVGIQFYQAMEQTAEEYESLRSTGRYKLATGQPEKGKVNIGGQSLGNWDIYSLLTCDVPNVLKELMTVRSDDFKSKREMTINIIENGKANMPSETGDAATKDLYRVHMIAMGLKPV